MKYGCFSSFRFAHLFILVGALSLTHAHADEYSEVSQLMRAGKLSEAQAKIDRHLASKPRDPQMRFFKGVIQREAGRPAEAIATFTRLTEDFPELPEPYNNLAVIHASQGQYDKARAALEMAIRTNPSYATAHENLGDIYARLASQAYSKALQIDGSSTHVQPKLALIRELFNTPDTTARTTVAVAPAKPGAVAAAPTPVPAAPPVAVAAAPAPAKASPAPATPSATAAPAPVAAAKPAPAPAAPAADSAAEVEQAVRAWAQAWSDRSMPRYLAAYSKDFETPDQMSRSAWEEHRRVRIVGKARISVGLDNLEVTVNGDKAVAKFQQDYKADTFAVVSLKTLELVKSGGRWLIVKETSGN